MKTGKPAFDETPLRLTLLPETETVDPLTLTAVDPMIKTGKPAFVLTNVPESAAP